MLAHDVYFTLKDNSPAAKQRLVEACRKHLSDHPGTVWFSAAVRAEEFDRPVNDQDFDVALHLVFRDKAAHDAYQEAPKHQQFIEENRDNWKQVRVFDSYVVASRRAEPAR
jgi:quinol monooxygenase YgiN